MQVELLEWNFWHGAELQAGLGPKFVKLFRACIQNFFITLRVGLTIFSFRDIDLLCLPR